MAQRTERRLITVFTLAALCLLMLCSEYAISAAAKGVRTCALVIFPSLLPFFVLSNILSALGFPEALGRRLQKPAQRLFGVSGEGCAAFFIGLTGGYPLGAATVAEIYRGGGVKRDEAERMLAFCNNTGPAFILGTAGAAVFSSVKIGLLLYVSHALAAVAVGVLAAPRRAFDTAPSTRRKAPERGFVETLVGAVRSSVISVMNICGFVVFFSAVLGILSGVGLLGRLAGEMSLRLPLGLSQCTALLTGLLELGGGITALQAAPNDALSAGICAFILGWGGLSVHCQTMAAVSGTDLRLGRHFIGRVLHGAVSAVIAVSLFPLAVG